MHALLSFVCVLMRGVLYVPLAFREGVAWGVVGGVVVLLDVGDCHCVCVAGAVLAPAVVSRVGYQYWSR